MKQILSILLILSLSNHTKCQIMDVKICGTVKEMNSSKPISNTSIYIIENIDTIAKTISDSMGEFTLVTKLNINSITFIKCQYDKRYFQKILIHNAGEPLEKEYVTDIHFYIQNEFICDLCEYYKLNEIKKNKQFELQWIKVFLDENPDICLSFEQKINPSESKRIAKKRLSRFIKELEKMKFNMQQLIFIEESQFLDETELINDPRSRMIGSIISWKGCN